MKTSGRPLLCFIHIERAGGTTLHYILRNNSLGFLTLDARVGATHDDRNALQAREIAALCRWLPGVTGFGGHSTRSYLGYAATIGRPVKYITFLRHPVERYLSHFRYQRDRMGMDWTLDTFLQTGAFSNFMTKRIAGDYDVSAAKRALSETFSFVGLTERFDESLVLMKTALGMEDLDIRYERRNANTVDAGGETQLDEGTLGRVRENNALDIELYEFAREQVFQETIRTNGDGLAARTAEFVGHNGNYRFSRSRRLLWAAYRFAVYKHVERVIHHRFHRGRHGK